MRRRPIRVTILAALSSVALILAIVHLLQALGIVPYVVGPIYFHDFNIWYVLMWALMIWVWAWVVRVLLAALPEGWYFLLIVSGFGLMFDFITMIFSPTTVTDLTVSFILNLVIFGYTLMPGTK